MLGIKYTMEIVIAFTELKDQTNKNTNKQLQAVIKCCKGDVQAPGLHAIEYLTGREKSKMTLRKLCLLHNPSGEWQKNRKRGSEGGRLG